VNVSEIGNCRQLQLLGQIRFIMLFRQLSVYLIFVLPGQIPVCAPLEVFDIITPAA